MIEEIDEPVMWEIRHLDKLIDELARGRPISKSCVGMTLDEASFLAFAFKGGLGASASEAQGARCGLRPVNRFDGTCDAYELLGGAANVDDFVIPDPDGVYRATTFRLLGAETREWSIYWADDRRSALDQPVRGRFDENGVGTFHGHDTYKGRDVRIHFIWSEISCTHARWEQAFSLVGSTGRRTGSCTSAARSLSRHSRRRSGLLGRPIA